MLPSCLWWSNKRLSSFATVLTFVGPDRFRQRALTSREIPSSDEDSCNRPTAECFSLFIVVYQFQIRCHDSITTSDCQLSSPYVYLCCNNGGTWREVHKALRVFWLTPRKGWEVSSCNSRCNRNEMNAYMQQECKNWSLCIHKTPTCCIQAKRLFHLCINTHVNLKEQGPWCVSQMSQLLPALTTGMAGPSTCAFSIRLSAQNARPNRKAALT